LVDEDFGAGVLAVVVGVDRVPLVVAAWDVVDIHPRVSLPGECGAV